METKSKSKFNAVIDYHGNMLTLSCSDDFILKTFLLSCITALRHESENEASEGYYAIANDYKLTADRLSDVYFNKFNKTDK